MSVTSVCDVFGIQLQTAFEGWYPKTRANDASTSHATLEHDFDRHGASIIYPNYHHQQSCYIEWRPVGGNTLEKPKSLDSIVIVVLKH